MRITKRILAIVLAALMAISMMPFTVFAGTSYSGYVVADGDNGEDLHNKEVYFNGYTWYIIEDNSTSETEGTVTLFAADTSFGTSAFNSTNLVNKYSTSMVKTYLDGMTETGGAFADVADAIETVTLTTDNDTDVTAKLYLLSKSEAGALPVNVLMLGNFTNADYYGETYWLRSPNPNDGMEAAYVNTTDGTIYNGSQVYRTFGVRPALKLDLSKVEFNSETNTFAEPAPDLPTVNVTPVTGAEKLSALDAEYIFSAIDDADSVQNSAYKDYIADFVITFDKDIEAGDVKLSGSYEAYDNGKWVEFDVPALAAGEEYRLLENAVAAMGEDYVFTYEDICTLVKEFKCGARGLNAAGVKMTVALNLYENASAQAETVADENYTFKANSTLPTADVTKLDTAGLPVDLEVAYTFKAKDTDETVSNSAYRSHIADFVVSFDKDIKAGDVKLAGSYEGYNNGEWVELSLPALAAGEEYRLLENAVAAMGEDYVFTYEDICTLVKEFKCGAKGLDAAGVKMTVALNLYETDINGNELGEVATVADRAYTFGADATLPTATVTEITGAEKLSALDVEYLFSADDDADSIQNSAYKDYIADFVITFDKAIEAGDVKLAGSYEGYNNGEWVEFDVPALAAGEEYRLLENAVAAMGHDAQFTYEDICTIVKEFKCGARGLNAAGVSMNVALNLYETDAQGNEVGDAEEINSEDYTFTADASYPDVEITPLDTAGLPIDLETAYTFKAMDTAESIANSAYRSHIADFVVSFDKDIEAGDVKLAGSYEGYNNGEWVEFSLPALAAGEEYRLLENAVAAMGEDYVFTYEDICTLVKEFKCGAKGLDAAGVKMTVALNLYETDINGNELGEVADIADTEYTFIDTTAIDKYSITISDAIDMNIYIANNVAGLAAIRYTFNGTPEEEANEQTVEVISGDDLVANADNYFEYSITLAPAQIEDTITIELLDSSGALLRPAITTSIASYCKQLRDNDNLAAELGITDDLAAKYQELAKATLDYGKAAAEYFNYYNKGAFESEYNLDEADFSVYDGTLVANATGVGITEVTYRAVSVPSIRFVLNMTEAEASKLSASSNIGNASLIKVDGKVVLEVAGIPASQLDDALTINLSNGAVINYTPIVYAKKAAAQGGALGDLGSAIANYSQAANAVFAD